MTEELLPWPLRTVRLLDGNLAEVFVWTGWEYPDAVDDLPNDDTRFRWMLVVDGDSTRWYANVGVKLRTWIHEVLELHDAGFPSPC